MSTQRTGIVVPHTHWDRAWYLSFQAYRLRLVEMVAELLDLLESGTLPNFVLDGQTVVLEDHLAIRPQDRPRIRTLVEAGRLRLGPWYTMPDCFLARPESLIRNLQRGIGIASEHGGASRVGYVPDSFGHFAQLPQILAGFGIDSFLFMRGMPVEVRDRDGAIFTWRAPDGSEVLATFLREGYFPLGALGQESFHGRYDGLAASDERARERLSHTLARVLPFQKQPVVVLPAGGDHLPARGDLAAVVADLNASQSEIRLAFGSFEDYLAALRAAVEHEPLPVFSGDLLGQADHPLLRNVLSSRVDLKILNHRAQSLLTRVVEPLAAWASINGLPGVEPVLVEAAWDALLKNHAHDDICGCSVDDVHLDDVQRFHEVLALAQEMITRQIEHLVQHRLPAPSDPRTARVFAFNPHPWPVTVSAAVRILLPDEGGEFSEPSAARQLRAVD
ncbi:MAG: glycoside hydrolase, partial [Planctomycetota bacterium]